MNPSLHLLHHVAIARESKDSIWMTLEYLFEHIKREQLVLLEAHTPHLTDEQLIVSNTQLGTFSGSHHRIETEYLGLNSVTNNPDLAGGIKLFAE